MLRYVGDSKGLKSRVRQHCTGNVESSALRKTIAKAMGFTITSTKRPSGSKKIGVEPSSAEQSISEYIHSGVWKVMTCASADEAREFQWYAIDKLRPVLNKYMQFWDTKNENVYASLLDNLLDSIDYEFASTLQLPHEPGVYSLWHDQAPENFTN